MLCAPRDLRIRVHSYLSQSGTSAPTVALQTSGAGPPNWQLLRTQAVIAFVAGERNTRRPQQIRTAFPNELARKSNCAGRIFDHPVGLLCRADGSDVGFDASTLHLTKSQETGLDDFDLPIYNNCW